MEANPYKNLLDPDEPVNSLADQWTLASAVAVVGLLVAIGVWSDFSPLSFGSLFVGTPVVSFIAGRGRSRDPVATVGAGIFIAIAGIIAFLPVCGVIGILSGIGMYDKNEPEISTLVWAASTVLSCAAVVWMHQRRGDERDKSNQPEPR